MCWATQLLLRRKILRHPHSLIGHIAHDLNVSITRIYSSLDQTKLACEVTYCRSMQYASFQPFEQCLASDAPFTVTSSIPILVKTQWSWQNRASLSVRERYAAIITSNMWSIACNADLKCRRLLIIARSVHVPYSVLYNFQQVPTSWVINWKLRKQIRASNFGTFSMLCWQSFVTISSRIIRTARHMFVP